MGALKGRSGWTVVGASLLLVFGFVLGQEVRACAPDGHRARATSTRVGDRPGAAAFDAGRERGARHAVAETAHAPSPPVALVSASGLRATARVDRTAVLQGSDGRVYVELALEADQRSADEARNPTDVIVVLDRSGSMAGQKLEYAKRAALHLVQRLADHDRFALITYDTYAERVFGLSPANAVNRKLWRKVIENIGVAGSTNLSGGLDLAIDELGRAADPRRVRRVLLLSDGLANQGDTSANGLRGRARRVVERGAVLTSMGIGDDFDQGLMSALSDAGEGNFYYLARLDVLPRFFEAELAAANGTVASNVTVHFVPGGFVQLIDASGYPLERSAGEVSFRPGALFSGQKRSLWLALSVPTEQLATFHLGALRVSYTRRGEPMELSTALLSEVECVREQSVFEQRIVREVWEAALLREELGKVEQRLADAVQNGTDADVDRVLDGYVQQNQRLAQQLGSTAVQASIEKARQQAQAAKSAQAQPSTERAIRGKRMQAAGNFARRLDAYSADPYAGF